MIVLVTALYMEHQYMALITKLDHWGATSLTNIYQPEVLCSIGHLRLHCASNMAVNLTDLSLQQLEGLKTQLEQVRKLFSRVIFL